MQENISIVKDKCFGCRSCEQVCPKKCIDIKPNEEGFLYPLVEESVCIHCGLCVKSCPAENPDVHRNHPSEMYGLKNKDEKAIMRSASGGASDAAAKVILAEGGVIFGAAYDENLRVSHIEVNKIDDLYKIQSSKYVQSNVADCYSKAKKHLQEGRKVLFTGTPCQIAGLYAFLRKDYDNLYTLDLICHGVPSPLFFEKYIDYMGKKMGGKVIEYNFRSKDKRGWGTQYLAKTKTKTKTNILALSKYGKHFMDGDCYRMSCYQCPFACMERCGDLTIGDFWAVNKYMPEMFSSNGVSSISVNSEKGTELLTKMNAEIKRISEEAFVAKQGNLVHATIIKENRFTIYQSICKEDFMDGITVGLQLKQRLKAFLPQKFIMKLKEKL